MPNVQQAIEHAASRFALEVVKILRGATLSELHALTGKAPSAPTSSAGARAGRRPAAPPASPSTPAARGPDDAAPGAGRKRSPEEVARLGERVLEFLRGAKQELGLSAIAAGLKVPSADLGLPLTRLRDAGKVKTHGKKRSTVYRIA